MHKLTHVQNMYVASGEFHPAYQVTVERKCLIAKILMDLTKITGNFKKLTELYVGT